MILGDLILALELWQIMCLVKKANKFIRVLEIIPLVALAAIFLQALFLVLIVKD